MDEVALLERARSIGRVMMISSAGLLFLLTGTRAFDANESLWQGVFGLLCLVFTIGSALHKLAEMRLGGHIRAWLLPEHITWARRSLGQPVVRCGLLLCLFGLSVLVWAWVAQNLTDASARNGPWLGLALMGMGAALVAWGARRVR